MKILVTRPQEKSEEMALDLCDMGFDPLISPVLGVVPIDFDVPDMQRYGGFLFTSANGVHCFVRCELPDIYDLPVFTVGDVTRNAALDNGFTHVNSAGGDVQDLVDLVAQHDHQRAYLHVRGKHVAAPLHVLLGQRDITVDVLQVYDTQPVSDWSQLTVDAIRSEEVGAVILYSSRSAEAFATLIQKYDLGDYLSRTKVLSISQAVLGCVQIFRWQGEYVAEKPDKTSFYKLFRHVCSSA